jgi:lipopolysaccharide/colanic/teichoic acid biosynthesis glycosyltransferase
MRSGLYQRFGKRAFDVAISLVALVLLAPILFFVALLVRFFLGSPVLFCQQRPGRNGKPFSIMKFRTMIAVTHGNGSVLTDAERLTGFGRLLRSTSLDELPELLNVLRGDMSLVGPRPLLMEYLPLYSAEQMRRHAVLPGITGWAQVNGRNAATWADQFACDLYYAEHLSLSLDLKIIAMTLGKLIIADGITQPGRATRDYFRGDERSNDPQAADKQS